MPGCDVGQWSGLGWGREPSEGEDRPLVGGGITLGSATLVRYEECLAQNEGAGSTDVQRRSCNEKITGTSATLRTGLPSC